MNRKKYIYLYYSSAIMEKKSKIFLHTCCCKSKYLTQFTKKHHVFVNVLETCVKILCN